MARGNKQGNKCNATLLYYKQIIEELSHHDVTCSKMFYKFTARTV